MNRRSRAGLRVVALAGATLLMAGPLVWMLVTSLKPPEQLRTEPHALLPSSWRWQNYGDAVRSLPLDTYLPLLSKSGSISLDSRSTIQYSGTPARS